MRTLLILLLFCHEVLAAQGPRRFLLVVGENRGEPGQESLRFAEADARSVREVMVSLGGVQPRDTRALFGATADDLRTALAALERDMAGAGPADHLFVYVSSHAADGALQLRGTAFPLVELRRFVERAPVGVAVVVVDTCHAAWLTRAKGLEPLTDRTVVVEDAPVAGRVFIASAGPFEPAQESDRLGGSYFTHHLVAGLRGAADRSADGQITLWEAFAYAHAHTVSATVGSRGGRQTPSYEVQLEGQRELVLTEVHRGRALLTLTQARPADWAITALDGDRRTTRFTSSGPMVFSLNPGTYRIRVSSGAGALEHEVALEEGAVFTVNEPDLASWQPADEGRTKGGGVLSMAAGAHVGTATVAGTDGLAGVLVALDYAAGRLGYGVQVGLRLGEAETPSGDTFRHREIDLLAQLTFHPALDFSALRVGAGLGGVLVVQQGTPQDDLVGFQPRLGAVLGVRMPVTEATFLDLSSVGGGQWVRVDGASRIDPFVVGSLAFGMSLSP